MRVFSPLRFLSRLLSFVFILALLAALAGAYVYFTYLTPTGKGRYTLEVKPGAGVAEVSRDLEKAGLVKDAQFFRLVLRYTRVDRGIKEGLYDLSGKMSALELARALEKPPRIPVTKVVIPEGLKLSEVVARLVDAGYGPRVALVQAFENTALVPYAAGAPNLEGFLFPATYEFRLNAKPAEIAKAITARFEQSAGPQELAKLKALSASGHPLKPFEWVTLASMVQAEAGTSAEMPIIAGVFLNRLKAGMPLQSDPTVAYGLGKTLLDRGAGDFKRETPYNTYTVAGLPPGPIDNPGDAALSAVLNPKFTGASGKPFLYFLHGKKGEFRVNSDFQSHLRDVARFR